MNPAEIDAAELPRRKSSPLVGAAVQQNGLFSLAGLNERAFTFAFSSLVYPQIWEDPVVDLEALRIESGHRVITIASGGCNADGGDKSATHFRHSPKRAKFRRCRGPCPDGGNVNPLRD